MDILIMVSIMTLVLFVSSGSARAATLIIPPTSGQNATDDISPTAGENDKPARSRVSQWASCVGTFEGEAQFWPSERIYRLHKYNSDKDSTDSLVFGAGAGVQTQKLPES
ncbi:hypothetical protein F2Q68_00000781 [Brassica cretica]|uniref:Neprosin domain-containing protein n=1 Tax=Brassica cretica TaxID=69181 RepID=A0A8S9JCX3_BRACR|nr:hypothetical protein F2Q68_00000781 [Brassica cretica]